MTPGRPIWIHSTKHDGSPHYRYGAVVVEHDAERTLAYTPPDVAVASYRGSSSSDHHCLKLFWPDRHYNLFVMWGADWSPREHYVNLATPRSFDDDAVRFVDLDLDVIWRKDGGVVLDDEEEWDRHRVTMAYPPPLVERVLAAKDELMALIAGRVWPFDGSLYGWRPSAAVADAAARLQNAPADSR